MTTTLLALPYSPWSEKARWALDHHRVAYREQEHVPMLGAPLLRLRARRLFGKLTVPMLFDERGRVISDSYNIARYAEQVGSSMTLFPLELAEGIEQWNTKSEAVLAGGRALLTPRVADDPAALEEALPAFIPSPVARRMRTVARLGAHYIATKYNIKEHPAVEQRSRIHDTLLLLRRALQQQSYVLGRFTFADIAMACSLQMVRPAADRWIPLGPATRRCWTDAELATEFEDLLTWRDKVYAEHR